MAGQEGISRPLGYGSPFNLSLTYSFINNNQFYPLIPKEYYQYYQRFVKQAFYWYDGYVPYFHNANSGIFSTRIANTICKRLAEHTNGSTLGFDYLEAPNEQIKKDKLENKETDKDKDSLKFINEWANENDFSNLNSQLFEYAFAGGDSLSILNYDGKDLWAEALRKDYYFFETDYRGKIIDITYFLYTYTQDFQVNGEQQEDTYYLLQRRYFDENDEPKYEIFVKKLNGNMVNNKPVDPTHQTVDWDSLPKNVKKSIKRDFNTVEVGVAQDLPFEDHLGVYLYKATKHLSILPASPYGESVLNNILSYLWSFDYYFSCMNTDQYLGRGRVLTPMSMQQNIGYDSSNVNSYGQNYNSGLDSFTFTKMEFIDPEHQKPTPIQFDLRVEDWTGIRNQLIELIATAIGISVRTLAGYLNNTTNVTAREISTEESETALFVENKRELFKTPINKMLKDILDFYGYDDCVVVKFSKAGLTNMNNLTTIITTLKQNNLIDDKTAISTLFSDKTQSQQEEMLRNIPLNINSSGIGDMVKDNRLINKDEEQKTQEMGNDDINHSKKIK